MKIAFSGKMFAGKTTAANYIIEKYKEDNYRKVALADSLKYEVKRVFGVDKTHPNGRKILQMIGTEVGRNLVDENIWVNKTLEGIVEGENIVLDDLRFKNEAYKLRENGFYLVRIFCNKPIRKLRGKLENEGHQSEIDLDTFKGFDYTITNNGTLEEFYSKLDDLVRKLP